MRTTTQLRSRPQRDRAAADADRAGCRDDRQGNGRSGPASRRPCRADRRALPRPERADQDQAARSPARERATVLELTELIGTTQQNVSKHLGVLHRAGIVARRKQGNFVHYERRRRHLRALRDSLRQPRAAGQSRCAVVGAGERADMLELFQTEWCPASRRVPRATHGARPRLRDHQVPVEREGATALLAAPAQTRSPRSCSRTARLSSARSEICAYLDEHYNEPPRPRRTARRPRRRAAAT